jgi:ribose 5-phosphate isomerase A
VSNAEDQKRAVGYRAVEYIEDGMVLGLGTGSTVRFLLEAIETRRERGELANIIGVPTSEDTSRRAEALGIPLSTLAQHPSLDLALDGADEVDPSLLREKVVVTAAADFIVLVDASKLVDRLGRKAPLPVEIDEFSLGVQLPFLRRLGSDPTIRRAPGGEPYRTDGGHLIIDCRFPDGIPDAHVLAAELDSRPGIMEHGLFLGSAKRVIVARPDGCEVLTR